MAPCFIYYQHCIYTNKWSTDFKKHAMFCYSYRLEMHTYYITGCTDNNIIVCVVFMRWNPRVNFVKSSNLFSSTVILIFYTLCHISIIIYVHLYYSETQYLNIITYYHQHLILNRISHNVFIVIYV